MASPTNISAFTIYDHAEIQGVLSEIIPFQAQLGKHFGQVMNFETENINFDKIFNDLRVSIYVDPALSAKPSKNRGFATTSYTAPYTKQKEIIDVNEIYHRVAGEKINQFASPSQKFAYQLLRKADTMRTKHARRIELDQAALLLAGKYTAVSELYPTPNIIDFERKAVNTRDFTTEVRNGGAGLGAWDATGGSATVSPWADIDYFLSNCQEHIEVLYIQNTPWKYLVKDPDFKAALSTIVRNRSELSVELSPFQASIQGLKFRGELASNGTLIYTYNGLYQDPITGVNTQYIPDNYILGVPSSAFGTVAYGAIQHGAAGYQSVDMFWNMWQDEEFGTPYIQMQSAPLLVHQKINSTFAAKVTSGGSTFNNVIANPYTQA